MRTRVQIPEQARKSGLVMNAGKCGPEGVVTHRASQVHLQVHGEILSRKMEAEGLEIWLSN